MIHQTQPTLKRKSIEKINVGNERDHDILQIEHRCDLDSSHCPPPTTRGGGNKPAFLVSAERVVKLCKFTHLRSQGIIQHLTHEMNSDGLIVFEEIEICHNCNSECSTGVEVRDSRGKNAVISYFFCTLVCTWDWAKKSNQSNWDKSVREKRKDSQSQSQPNTNSVLINVDSNN